MNYIIIISLLICLIFPPLAHAEINYFGANYALPIINPSSFDYAFNPDDSPELSRDKARIRDILKIETALLAYYVDNEKLPSAEGKCVPEKSLRPYFIKGVPKDPLNRNTRKCKGKNMSTYEYGTFKGIQSMGFYVLAKLEGTTLSNIDSVPFSINKSIDSRLKQNNGKSGYYISVFYY